MKRVLLILAFVAGFVMEVASLWLFSEARAGLLAFVLHLTACALLLWAFPREGKSPAALPGSSFWLGSLMVSMPGAGPLCAFASLAACYFVPSRPKKLDPPVLGIPPLPGERDFPGSIRRADSVLKILGSPDPIQRREAITSLRSEPSAGAVLILQRAVYDSDDYVRTSAQSQLARWSEASELEIKHLEKRNIGESPTPLDFLDLAAHYEEAVSNRLAGPELEGKFLNRTVELLRKIPAQDPLSMRASLASLRSLLVLGKTHDARKALQRMRDAGFQHESLFLMDMEILFRERNWTGLRDCLQNEAPASSGEPWPLRSKEWEKFIEAS